MLINWIGPAIFECEVRGEEVWDSDKGVVESVRLVRKFETWNDQTARLFACDCAEAVVHLAKDKRSEAAIRISRRYVFQLATKEELAGAAYAASTAASAAASTAAWAAARAAARTAQTKRLFQYLNDEVDLEAMKASLEKEA